MADDITTKQQEVIDYLRAHGPTRQGELAEALGSTLRGIGVRLSALTWKEGHYVFRETDSGGAADHIWKATP